MSTLTFYILRQLVVPLVVITITLSGIVWLLRALRLLDTIVISGQSLQIWLELLFYTMPAVISLVLPAAFLLACFYSFYRLFMDSEIIVMFSSGISRLRLARPVMLICVPLTLIMLAINFYAIPWSNKMLKARSLEINSDIASAMLRPGVFTNPVRGMTAYIRSRDENGFLHKIFFQDNRNPDKPVSYTAESGALIRTNNRTELIMFDGHIQHYDRKAGHAGITLVKFDRYRYDLSQLAGIRPKIRIRTHEMYPQKLYETLNSAETTPKQKNSIQIFIHQNFLQSIYLFVYGLIVLAVFLPAQVNRRGYRRRIIAALAVALATRLSATPLLQSIGENPYYIFLVYAIPLVVMIGAWFILSRGVGPLQRLRHRWKSPAPLASNAEVAG